ncbi:two-component sensor histidine kinase [Sphingomonas kyeonggiensis]|uniref:sensor histidine kinase n=1 Tax=Sphingomonas kyeonggiensis TaxID=1268553 RepID=UPI00277FD664|nr:sensor histidine kinase [Sphingomonas kyeonggiensis]MDQ0249073.1 two-component sensor histidine kinase [Sphingomonas kyeonggiensis]
MGRIGETDLADRLAPGGRGALLVQLGFGLLITGLAIGLRAVIDGISPAAGPFALGFPAVLIATLFGRWQAGLLTGTLTLLYSWYFVLPVQHSFLLKTPDDTGRLVLATINYAAVLVIAELFRRAVRRATAERDRELAERDLFLEEFDHRVKNNFTLVAALLDMQRRRAKEGETAEALSSALNRVESIARAHRHLYRGGAATRGEVDMATYLEELCAALAEALFLRGAITLDCFCDHGAIPRDRAVSIGLIVNELVTNAAKHAFAGRHGGRIEVRFEAASPGWRLVVRDDGVGMPETPRARKDGGLGQKLVDGFVRQARGKANVETGTEGTKVTVALEA